jgi:tRNA 2-thiocytidine biosynthesis protein TtcA
MRVLCEEGYGIPLSIEPVAEEDLRGGKRDEITCFGCAFQRRKALFIAAHRMGCNRIAFAHHRDDAATTTMLNLFRHGTLVGLEPVRVMFGGALTLIRPLIAVDERRIADFNRARGIPEQVSRCPNAATSERLRMGRILRELEKECPGAKGNLLKVSTRGEPSEDPEPRMGADQPE